jgi:hypothetical protein
MKAQVQSTAIPTGMDTPSAIFAVVDSPKDVVAGVLFERRPVEVVDNEVTTVVFVDGTGAAVCEIVALETIGENSNSAPASSCR